VLGAHGGGGGASLGAWQARVLEQVHMRRMWGMSRCTAAKQGQGQVQTLTTATNGQAASK